MIQKNNNREDVGLHHGAAELQRQYPLADASGRDADAPRCIPTMSTTNCIIANPLPRRKNLRAEFHDYSGGDYFVTICTRDKEHYFGRIHEGEMVFSEIGKMADLYLKELHTHYSYVDVPQWVVMPNHVHAIIVIRDKTDAPGCVSANGSDAPGCVSANGSDAPGCIPTIRTALGVVVGGYKQAVTRYARRHNIGFGWQPRYHDHIIRGITDGNKISEYIENNIVRWDTDCFNNTNRTK